MKNNRPRQPDYTKGDKTAIRLRKQAYKRCTPPSSFAKYSKELGINVNYLYYFVMDGVEPSADKDRKILGLSKKRCPVCGRRIVLKKKERKEKSEYEKEWLRLPSAEKKNVIETYIRYKKEKKSL